MPGVDGFALAAYLAGVEHPPAIVMMLAPDALAVDAERCRQLGIVAVLRKPIGPIELRDAALRALTPAVPTVRPPRRATAGESPPARALRILVAEDNTVNQRLVTRILERRGHVVALAAHGGEALAALAGERFDIVLMDVQMPEMDGFEATAAIRAREHASGERIPIIALTAHAMKGDEERCTRAGMDAYIAKPLDPKRLVEMIERFGDRSASGPSPVSISANGGG